MAVLSTGALSLVQTITGSLSAFASFLIIWTYYQFKELQKLKNVELIFYVAVSTFLASIGMALGQQDNESFGCWFQALVTNYFYLVSIFWVTVTSFQVYSIIFSKEHLQNMLKYHVFCWGFPLIVTLLPLTTNTYGNNPSWCYIKNTSYSPAYARFMWELLAENLWIALAIAINIVFLVPIRIRMRSMLMLAQISMTVTKLIWYPRMLIICWGSAFILIIYDRFNIENNESLVIANNTSIILVTFQGVFMAIIFFVTNGSIRELWYNYWTDVYNKSTGKRGLLGGSTVTRGTEDMSSPATSVDSRVDSNSYYIHTAQSLDSLQATQNALHQAKIQSLRNEVIEDYVDEEHYSEVSHGGAGGGMGGAGTSRGNLKDTMTSKQSLYSLYDRSSSEAFTPYQKPSVYEKSDVGLSLSLKQDSFMPHNEDNDL